MTPAQALANLDGAAARAALTRADHVAIQESTAVLKALVDAEAARAAAAAEHDKP